MECLKGPKEVQRNLEGSQGARRCLFVPFGVMGVRLGLKESLEVWIGQEG